MPTRSCASVPPSLASATQPNWNAVLAPATRVPAMLLAALPLPSWFFAVAVARPAAAC